MSQFLSSWPVLFVSALGYHIGRLLTFRHDGTGLPGLHTPVTALLFALSVLVSLLRFALIQPELNLALVLLANLVFVVLLYGLVRGDVRMSALVPSYLLISIGIDLLLVILNAAVPVGAGLKGLVEVWSALAWVALYFQLRRAK